MNHEHLENSSLRGIGGRLNDVFRRFLFNVLSVGSIPNHVAFIMDGNRRYARKKKLDEGAGHKAGLSSLMSMLKYCYELGVKYITVYAFSIDNFKRNPDEVKRLMDLMLEGMEKFLLEDSVVNEYGVRVYFIGDSRLLNEPVRIAAENVMRATAKHTKCVLLLCVAYTSPDEIVRAVEESCADKIRESEPFNSPSTSNGAVKEFRDDMHSGHEANDFFASKSSSGCDPDVKNCMVRESCQYGITNGANAFEEQEKMAGDDEPSMVKVVDIEKHMDMSVAPDPDILIRTSGETRLSNLLLWQTSNCPLYSTNALRPEIGLQHLVWGVIIYQRNHAYLEKKKKQS